MPVDASTLYRWHARDGAFQRLVPPWDNIETIAATGGIQDGAKRIMKLHQGPMSLTWEANHYAHIKDEQFVDEQVRGPFKRWVHTHRFEAIDNSSSRLVDHIDYELPLAGLGRLAGGSQTQKMLQRMFTFRHRRTFEDLLRHNAHQSPLTIAITGSSGLIGTALKAFLTTGGHRVRCLKRAQDDLGADDIYWSPSTNELDHRLLDGIDAMIHLSGEPISQRWDEATKQRIEQSRIQSTKLISTAISRLDVAPSVFISASGVGYYGDTESTPVDETDPPGETFLARLCQRWEAATAAATDAGIRTVHLRIGVVLSPQGGALPEFQRALKWGLASRLGPGDQTISWIDRDDLLGAILFALNNPTLQGAVNATSPHPVTNRALMDHLADLQSWPSFIPVPSALIKGVMGRQAGEEVVLTGQHALPSKLVDTGFQFYYPSIESSLQMKLGLTDDFTLSDTSDVDASTPHLSSHSRGRPHEQ